MGVGEGFREKVGCFFNRLLTLYYLIAILVDPSYYQPVEFLKPPNQSQLANKITWCFLCLEYRLCNPKEVEEPSQWSHEGFRRRPRNTHLAPMNGQLT